MAEGKPRSNKYSSLWKTVQDELNKNDKSADKVAILEAEKILREILEEKNLPGKDIDSKIKNYSTLFSNYEKLKYSRIMRKKIIDKIGFDISRNDTEEIFRGYQEAISDLEKIDFKNLPRKEKIGLFLKRNFFGWPQKAKKAGLALVALSLIVFFLTESAKGRAISAYFVSLNNYLFYEVIPAILILVALVALIIAVLYIYQRKEK